MEHTIITASSINDLITAVSVLLSANWTPLGDLVIESMGDDDDDDENIYHQAMTRL